MNIGIFIFKFIIKRELIKYHKIVLLVRRLIMRRKQIIAILAAATMTLGTSFNSLAAVSAETSDQNIIGSEKQIKADIKNEKCGENMTWSLSEDGTLTISGTGSMYNYNAFQHSPWMFYEIKKVVIEDGVTSIGNCAFYECKGITEVSIPDSVTSIGNRAFYKCNSLTKLSIPESVTSIDDCIFYECESLTEVNIPDGIKSIGEYTFFGCTNLKNVAIPAGVTSIEKYAFSDCNEFTEISLPDGLTSIGEYAFSGCKGLKDIVIPAGVKTVENGAFSGCTGLTEINIPDGVTSIENSAFSGCTGLTKIILPDNLTSIGETAFYECENLKEINIPDSVTSIGDSAFGWCESLTDITIPEGVESIGSYAFMQCRKLKSVVLPSTLTDIGINVFESDYELSELKISENNQHFSADDHWLYSKDKKTIYSYFGKQDIITIIPDSVTTLDLEFVRSFSLTSHSYQVLFIPQTAVITDYDDLEINGVYKEKDGYKCFDNMIYEINKDGTGTIVFSDLSSDTIVIPSEINDTEISIVGVDAFNKYYSEKVVVSEGIKNIETYTQTAASRNNWNRKSSYVLVYKNNDPDDNSRETQSTEVMSCAKAKAYMAAHPELEFVDRKEYYSVSPFVYKSIDVLELPSTLEKIEKGAISCASQVQKIYIKNPKCAIRDYEMDSIIYGYAGSTAEKFAIEHGLEFHIIDDDDKTEKTSGAYKYVNLGNGVKIVGYTSAEGEPADIEVPAEIDGKQVLSIGAKAFAKANIRSITFPEGLVRIDRDAFGYFYINSDNDSAESTLEEIHLPASLKKLEGDINLASLKVITVSPDNTEYVAVDNVLYSKDQTKLITYPYSKPETEFTVPELTVYGVGDIRNRYLKKINIPKSVTSEHDDYLSSFCLPELEAVTVEEGNPQFYAESGVLYVRDTDSSYSGLEISKYHSLCLYPPKKKDSEFIVPEGVKEIASATLEYATELKKLVLPSSLDYIYSESLTSNTSITDYEVSESNETYAAIDGVLYNKNCDELIRYPGGRTDKEFVVPDFVKIIGDNSFTNLSFDKIVLPETIEEIEAWAFYNTKIKEIHIPDSIEYLNTNSFSESSSNTYDSQYLKIVDNWVVDLSYDCYHNYLYDENGDIMYDENGENLDDGKIYYYGTDYKPDEKTEYIAEDINIYIPDGIKGIAEGALYDSCAETIYIPKTVKYICSHALCNNKLLTDIYYEGSEEDWAKIKIYEQEYDSGTGIPSDIKIHYGETYDPETTKPIKITPVTVTSVTTATTTVPTESTTTTSTTSTSTPVSSNADAGDVNNDGIIDARDASAVLTYYAKSSAGAEIADIEMFNAEKADYNNDGIIDGRDATEILTYYAKSSANAVETTETTDPNYVLTTTATTVSTTSPIAESTTTTTAASATDSATTTAAASATTLPITTTAIVVTTSTTAATSDIITTTETSTTATTTTTSVSTTTN